MPGNHNIQYSRRGLTRDQNGYHIARKRMVEDQLIAGGIKNKRVLSAMSQIPRHLFVPSAMQNQAYSDYPLNIGDSQTISQPLIVAMMTELLDLKGHERVLEIGTGSGYQAAILADLCKHLYTIERIRGLANNARKALYNIGISNFTLRIGDGTLGWPEEAPFDAIIVTAGAPHIPEIYIQQMTETSKLVIPVGSEKLQDLVLICKDNGEITKTVISGCRFVKLIGEKGWSNI